MDGPSLEVTVAQRGLVHEVKRIVGQVQIASCARRSNGLFNQR
jgi:hypothetical protein